MLLFSSQVRQEGSVVLLRSPAPARMQGLRLKFSKGHIIYQGSPVMVEVACYGDEEPEMAKLNFRFSQLLVSRLSQVPRHRRLSSASNRT